MLGFVTDKGNVRELNEDFYLILEKMNFQYM